MTLTDSIECVIFQCLLSKAAVEYDSLDGFYIAIETDPDETIEWAIGVVIREIAHIVAAHRAGPELGGSFYDGNRETVAAILRRLEAPENA